MLANMNSSVGQKRKGEDYSMKKFLAMALALLMVAVLLPVTAMAA